MASKGSKRKGDEAAKTPVGEAGHVEPGAAMLPDEGKAVGTTKLTAESAVAASLLMMARAEVADRAALAGIARQKSQVAVIIVSHGMEVPMDEEEKEQAAKVVPASSGRGRGNAKGPGGKSLWEMVEEYLIKNGCFAPTKFATTEEVNTFAKASGYTTASNLLSNKKKEGYLIDGGRGKYGLPKGYKPGWTPAKAA